MSLLYIVKQIFVAQILVLYPYFMRIHFIDTVASECNWVDVAIAVRH